MRVGSFRWWFEDRSSGRITIAQTPNPPLWIAVAGWAIDAMFTGSVADIGRMISITALGWWGADEIARGVNPWRRVLGLAVIGWQLRRLLG